MIFEEKEPPLTPSGKSTKDFFERLIGLCRDDKELHDAAVRMINAIAEQTEIGNKIRKNKLSDKKS